jgi:hypothetical protein
MKECSNYDNSIAFAAFVGSGWGLASLTLMAVIPRGLLAGAAVGFVPNVAVLLSFKGVHP